ncbi:MAG: hypothetical protein ACOX87_14490 [Chloroflexota bacterium]|jgi:uncharacterized protein YjeT (DUF2065 family)
MQQLARGMGFISLIAGGLLLGFPETARRLIRARAEFAELSTNALRLLGVWELLMGTLLVGATAKSMEQARVMEELPPRYQKVA